MREIRLLPLLPLLPLPPVPGVEAAAVAAAAAREGTCSGNVMGTTSCSRERPSGLLEDGGDEDALLRLRSNRTPDVDRAEAGDEDGRSGCGGSPAGVVCSPLPAWADSGEHSGKTIRRAVVQTFCGAQGAR